MNPQDPDDRGVDEPSKLFRQEALDHYSQDYRLEGDLIRLSPAWLTWTAWLLLAVSIAVVFFAIFGTIDEYATGPPASAAAAACRCWTGEQTVEYHPQYGNDSDRDRKGAAAGH